MNQIVNIFRKDTRQLWIEILTSLTILGLFDIFEPKGWVGVAATDPTAIAAAALRGLLCIAWGVLIIRLIHAERLTGLNQFWTTRPYDWSKLMAAKGLFLLTYLYCPLMLSQMLLLHLGGFAVLPNMHLILWNLGILSILLILPLVCTAAITSSFGQAMLILLGALVGIIVLAVSTLGRRFVPLFLDELQSGIVVVVLSIALLYQYRRRATRGTILLYVLVIGLVFSAQKILPGSSLAVVGYARSSGSAPVTLAWDTKPKPVDGRSSGVWRSNKTVLITVPLTLSGITPGTSYMLEGQKVRMEGSDGYVWESPWENASAARFQQSAFSGIGGQFTGIILPRSVYDRLNGPVSVHMQFAVAQYQAMPVFQARLSRERERVPGLGSCSFDEDGLGMIGCRSLFGRPPEFLISSVWTRGRCGATPCDLPAHASIGIADRRRSFAANISPVTVSSAQFDSDGHQVGFLNVGAPVSYAGEQLEHRLLLEMPTTTVTLKDYVNTM